MTSKHLTDGFMINNKAIVHKNRKTHEGQQNLIGNIGAVPTGRGENESSPT